MNKENDDSKETKRVLDRARELAEINPMMGHRGVRVAITYPEIYKNAKLLQCLKRQHNLQKIRVNAKTTDNDSTGRSLAELNI